MLILTKDKVQWILTRSGGSRNRNGSRTQSGNRTRSGSGSSCLCEGGDINCMGWVDIQQSLSVEISKICCMRQNACNIRIEHVITLEGFPALLTGWVRCPGHVDTHTGLCCWNQPWTAAVGYCGPFCCTLEVLNEHSTWRNGLSTAS